MMDVHGTQRRNRPPIREAFAELVAVCMRYREVWCKDAASNQAMARLFTSVELLKAVEGTTESRPKWMKRPSKRGILLRLVDRLSQVYTLLEGMMGPEATATLLPPRRYLPTNEKALVDLATLVHSRVIEVPGAQSRYGSLAHTVRLLNASIKQYQEAERPMYDLVQMPGVLSTYDRQLNACIRSLIERVDVIMPRYADAVAFTEAYRAARERLFALPIDARRTYFVERAGQVSKRHPDALRQWPEMDGEERWRR